MTGTGRTLPTDVDPNWCPECLEPRGVCGCDMPEEPPDDDSPLKDSDEEADLW
jgi:hypothetical protein